MSTGPAVPAYSATLGSFNGCTPAPARPLPRAAPRTKSTSPPTPLTITSGFQSRRRIGSRSHQPRRLSAIPRSAAQASSPTRGHMARVRPLSEMAVSCPECRICSTSGWPTARAQSREPLPKACRLAAKLDESLAIGDEHGREGAGGKQARAETVDVDADGVHEAIAGAGEGEANRAFLSGGS